MNLLLIKVNKSNIEELCDKIKKEIESFNKEGIILEEKVTILGNIADLSYSVKIESIKNYPISDFINIFKYCMANALSEYIQYHEEPNIIRKIIDLEYYYFEQKEKEEIQKIALEIISEENKTSMIINQDETRKNKIINELVSYLKEDNEINIEGFITFRLQNYTIELEDTIEKAIEDYLMDREYNEFIKLLKYFVDIQESKINTIHIVIEQDHNYKMYDGDNNLINNDYLKDIAKEMTDHQYLSYEDILISTLITMAPQKIFIHRINNAHQPEIIKTIGRVFTTKVKVCNGCDWCNINSNVNNNEN
ncbi:putative sporulation protein YtxC [Alkaliphilus peptidifermentans]|uniref:Putative sporulation protein YtxC n=1 Tax=Alkaliphilus peptidifermentans DSM 18978 TaxID=1120976 RepID=A0A1G5IWV6_9FIRM|nr:putative sporulation protein YtxC [Alkaliphilus peptidifermentans]SCY80542.1 putative sporulation protein YtxC [Alkaliphilus peptidifermentans DSM 18978]